MAAVKHILVVTSTPSFGELIQQSLEETGEYKVSLVNSTQGALTCAQDMPFSLAILDSDLGDVAFPAIAHSLTRMQENLSLVVIPPENDPQHPLLRQLSFDGYFTKPFYLPDLIDTVSEVLLAKVKPSPTIPARSAYDSSLPDSNETEPSLEWLKDVSRAAQHLTRLSLETSAQAALIVRRGELWAYAGHLDQPAAQELAASVARFWTDSHQSVSEKLSRSTDLVRIVRLLTTGNDYLLYVTSLGREMVLALAFDDETPFSTIRAQAYFLARCLASPLDDLPPMKSVPGAKQNGIYISKRTIFSSSSTSEGLPAEKDIDNSEENLPQINLLPLMNDVPLPDPSKAPHQRNAAEHYPFPPSAMQVEQDDVDKNTPLSSTDDQPIDLTETIMVEQKLRPITPTLHGLYYVCLMIPRLPQHHLTGDLASALAEMIRQLCLAYGWRLEHISIRPEYLQWITSVPPVTSPSYLMRVLRQQTSERIFDAFPDLGKDNPSGDFWAPGYLIMSGAQLPPAQIVKEYIHQTRQQQGADSHNHPRV